MQLPMQRYRKKKTNPAIAVHLCEKKSASL
jgi:hypothetical protein